MGILQVVGFDPDILMYLILVRTKAYRTYPHIPGGLSLLSFSCRALIGSIRPDKKKMKSFLPPCTMPNDYWIPLEIKILDQRKSQKKISKTDFLILSSNFFLKSGKMMILLSGLIDPIREL